MTARICVALALLASLADTAFGQTSSLMGTVTYPDRVALSRTAVLEVTLEDVSVADAPAVVIATMRVPRPGQSPVVFSLPYDPSLIGRTNRYAVRAQIVDRAGVLFHSSTATRVLTQGAGSVATLTLVTPEPAPVVQPEAAVRSTPVPEAAATAPPPTPTPTRKPSSTEARSAKVETPTPKPEPAPKSTPKPDPVRKPEPTPKATPTPKPLSTEARSAKVETPTPEPVRKPEPTPTPKATAPKPLSPEARSAKVETPKPTPTPKPEPVRKPEPTPTPKATAPKPLSTEARSAKVETPKPVSNEAGSAKVGTPEGVPATLSSLQWTLTELENKPVRPASKTHRLIVLAFDIAGGTFAGTSGCNDLDGRVEAGARALKLTPSRSLKICRVDQRTERALKRMFNDTRAYQLTDTTLDLLDDRGKRIARLQGAAPAAGR